MGFFARLKWRIDFTSLSCLILTFSSANSKPHYLKLLTKNISKQRPNVICFTHLKQCMNIFLHQALKEQITHIYQEKLLHKLHPNNRILEINRWVGHLFSILIKDLSQNTEYARCSWLKCSCLGSANGTLPYRFNYFPVVPGTVGYFSIYTSVISVACVFLNTNVLHVATSHLFCCQCFLRSPNMHVSSVPNHIWVFTATSEDLLSFNTVWCQSNIRQKPCSCLQKYHSLISHKLPLATSSVGAC